MRILFRDLRPAGVCKEVRFLFFEKHGLDWRAFVRDGIEIEELLATGEKREEILRIGKIATRRIEKELLDGRG